VTRSAWFDGPLPRILAHRGLALEHPQNSLGAFRAALDAGATHLETDVRATLDGHAVLVHDPSVGSVDVATVDLTALRRLAPDVATLADALDALPDARFNIDIKAADAAGPVLAALDAAGPRTVDRVLITSFSARRRRAVSDALPGVAVSAAMSEAVPAIVGALGGVGALTRRALRGLDAVQLPERAGPLSTTEPRVVDLLQRMGVELHIWVVDDPERMRELVALGVAGIFTDRADLAASALS
jgi:glycerophosphoryl diester phosphodiesterase